MPIEAAPTVRDSLVSAMETVMPETPVETPAADTPLVEAKETVAPVETETQKTERLRDEEGKFVKGKAIPRAVETPPVVEPPKPKVPRPSSWKKELESHWETLAPEVQAYVGQREREYATGVSTYKTEADRAKDVMSTLSQFEPELQKSNVPVAQWLSSLGNADRTLSFGSPQDKVQQVARIIQGYGVDAQALYQLLSGQQPQYQQAAQRPPQPQFSRQDIEKAVEQKFVSRQAASDYEAFTKAKNPDGQEKYPYLEDVKGTMAGLLQAGLAQDYPSAYDAAVRLPQHANIWEVMQKQQTTQTQAATVQAATETAKRARSQAVSVKSSTPTTTPAPDKAKGLRDQLSESWDAVTAGRV
jgi:hypothetical protein